MLWHLCDRKSSAISLSWHRSYDIILQKKFKNIHLCAHVGNDRSGKWSNFVHDSHTWNRVPSSPQSLPNCLGAVMREVALRAFLFIIYIHTYIYIISWHSFFSLQRSACQRQFLGLIKQSLTGCYKTFRWILLYIIFWEIFSLLLLSLKKSQWFLKPVYWRNINQYRLAAEVSCNFNYNII